MGKQKSKLVETSEKLDVFTKPLRNIVWIAILIGGLWAQFIGPGIFYLVRKAAGTDELKEEIHKNNMEIHNQVEKGFIKLESRLLFIEENINPPQVAIWNWSRQLNKCNEIECRVMHNISRTEYGQNCGIPKASTEIKLSTGQKFDLEFVEGFGEIEATVSGRTVIVPFKIEDYIPDGVHTYQFTNLYPTCEWSREPIPRYSPWFTLIIDRSEND